MPNDETWGRESSNASSVTERIACRFRLKMEDIAEDGSCVKLAERVVRAVYWLNINFSRGGGRCFPISIRWRMSSTPTRTATPKASLTKNKPNQWR